MNAVMDQLGTLDQDQLYAVYAAAGLLVVMLMALVVRPRRPKQRKANKAYVDERAKQQAAEREHWARRSAEDRLQGRKVMYKREMSQRELFRYYGHLPTDHTDPTFEEWAAEKGYLDDDLDGLVVEG